MREGSGSLTAMYTVLVEGDDFNEPVSDTVRAILDGHIILSRNIAQRGRFPAIDVPGSISRLASTVIDSRYADCVREATRLIAAYEESRDLIELGAYKAGSNKITDAALKHHAALEQFLSQPPGVAAVRTEDLERLAGILGSHAGGAHA